MVRIANAKFFGVGILVILIFLAGHASAQSGIVTIQDINTATQVVEWQISQDLFVKSRNRKLTSVKIAGCWNRDELSDVKVTTARGRTLKVLRSRAGKSNKTKTYPIQVKTSPLTKLDFPLLVQATFSTTQIMISDSATVSGVTEGNCGKRGCPKGTPKRTKRLKSAGPSCSTSVPIATGGSITAVGPSGGDIDYPEIGTIHITPGTFGSDTAVRFEALSSPKLSALFEEFGSLFSVQNRMAYDLRIALKGSVPLTEVVSVEIVLPQAMRDLIGTGVRLDTFVRGIHGGELEELETIQLIPSALDAAGQKLLVDLPAYAFIELEATAISDLVCGTHQLTLIVDVAPDDYGTFQILLFNGLSFAGGATVQSGVLPEGATQVFEIFS